MDQLPKKNWRSYFLKVPIEHHHKKLFSYTNSFKHLKIKASQLYLRYFRAHKKKENFCIPCRGYQSSESKVIFPEKGQILLVNTDEKIRLNIRNRSQQHIKDDT